MLSLRSSLSHASRLVLSAVLISGAALPSARAQLGSPPRLASLHLQSGSGTIGFAPVTLNPTFDPDTLEYDVNIPFEHSQVQIASAEAVDPFHVVNEPVIPRLLPGFTTSLTITVEDDPLFPFQTTDYVINVTRGPSDNVAVLSNLVADGASLAPLFDQLTFGYSSSVPNGIASITITPTAQAGTSAVTVNGQAASSGSPFGPIALSEGPNTITIHVMDGVVTNTYLVDVTRQPSTTTPDSDGDGMDDGYETAHGLSVGLNDAELDLDGDGLSNIGEYAFGSNPDDSSDCNSPAAALNAQGFLVITFHRAIGPGDGSYEVQVSSTLSGWSSADVVEDGNSTPLIQVWRDTGGGAPSARFIRVAFTSTL